MKKKLSTSWVGKSWNGRNWIEFHKEHIDKLAKRLKAFYQKKDADFSYEIDMLDNEKNNNIVVKNRVRKAIWLVYNMNFVM